MEILNNIIETNFVLFVVFIIAVRVLKIDSNNVPTCIWFVVTVFMTIAYLIAKVWLIGE